MSLPRPGLVGILVRLAVAGAVAYMGITAWIERATWWDGFSDFHAGLLVNVAVLILLWHVVVGELVVRPWGYWPTIVVGGGLVATAAASAVAGQGLTGPWVGTYLWAWTLVFAVLLGPALLAAAIWRVPGCEMRAYAWIAATRRGDDPRTVACKGWIDRLDHVRIGGTR